MHRFLGTLYRLILVLEVFLHGFDEAANLGSILEVGIMNLYIVDIIALRLIWIWSISDVI